MNERERKKGAVFQERGRDACPFEERGKVAESGLMTLPDRPPSVGEKEKKKEVGEKTIFS